MKQRRQGQLGQRSKDNRSSEKTMTVADPEGDTEWEKALSMINFNFPRSAGTDLSRFKSVLFSAKSKNVAVAK